jgi:hypothetical protein
MKLRLKKIKHQYCQAQLRPEKELKKCSFHQLCPVTVKKFLGQGKPAVQTTVSRDCLIHTGSTGTEQLLSMKPIWEQIDKITSGMKYIMPKAFNLTV